jgi:PAS domain S-box-containing protein
MESTRVLLLDDDEDDYLLVRGMLRSTQQERFDVTWASSWKKGLDALNRSSFDAILVDYDLGEKNGIEFIRAARGQAIDTPILILTGRGGYDIDVKAMQAGATDYLNKNEINASYLERAIRYAIQQYKNETTLRQREAQLRASETRLTDYLESTHEGFIALDQEWRFIYINQRCQQITGFDPEILIGKNIWEEFPGLLGTPFEQYYRQTMLERVATHFQSSGVHSGAWYDISVNPAQDGITVFFTDRSEEKRIQQALRESERRERGKVAELEAIMDAVPAFVWISQDPQSRYIYGNQAAYDVLRMEPGSNTSKTAPEEELPTHFRVMRNGEEIPPEMLPVQVAAAQGTPIRDYEFDFVFNDGREMNVLGNATPLFDENGRPRGAVSAFIDISNRREMERALMQAKEEAERNLAQLETVMANISDGIVLIDAQGKVLLRNAAMFRITGLANGDETTVFDYKKNMDVRDAKNNPLAFTAWPYSRALGGEMVRDQEVVLRRLDQSQICYVLTSAMPIRDGQGEIRLVLVTVRDITERKRSEEALRTSENRLRVALSMISMNVFMLDTDLRYTWSYNPRNGLSPEALIGKTDQELFPGQDLSELEGAKREVIETGRGVKREVKFELVSGPQYSIITLEPVLSIFGKVMGLIGASIDITRQKQMEHEHQEYQTQMEVQRRLLEYREQERQLIARDLHDGPVQDLAGLLFNIQFAKESISDPAIRVEFEQIALGLKSAIQNLREMINELRPPSLVRFGLAKALQIYLEEFRDRHPEIEMDMTLMDDGGALPEQTRLNLYRITQEALVNITKHAHATQVAVHFLYSPVEVILRIQDNGQGFALMPDLIDYTMNGHYGLVGMKERAAAINGAFQVTSDPGSGAIIEVCVPLQPQTSQSGDPARA